ncbi:hypothetical protein BDK51DRAFT_47525 [Blyttiomyces helicus]|uniref:Uncharacterized protein n=1 Tax=Blyttiomyces helicus TaxID=388810 RepID=A0A4P9W3M9_9FUNG|nr:hypothetical protein BDK51DRAFT_47525 [Blyttiomyces helicus]|eukprot:RKO85863.1 hypothetical protein BDK51DRAFT_47525 [Blyttiomyces helicus]
MLDRRALPEALDILVHVLLGDVAEVADLPVRHIEVHWSFEKSRHQPKKLGDFHPSALLFTYTDADYTPKKVTGAGNVTLTSTLYPEGCPVVLPPPGLPRPPLSDAGTALTFQRDFQLAADATFIWTNEVICTSLSKSLMPLLLPPLRGAELGSSTDAYDPRRRCCRVRSREDQIQVARAGHKKARGMGGHVHEVMNLAIGHVDVDAVGVLVLGRVVGSR